LQDAPVISRLHRALVLTVTLATPGLSFGLLRHSQWTKYSRRGSATNLQYLGDNQPGSRWEWSDCHTQRSSEGHKAQPNQLRKFHF